MCKKLSEKFLDRERAIGTAIGFAQTGLAKELSWHWVVIKSKYSESDDKKRARLFLKQKLVLANSMFGQLENDPQRGKCHVKMAVKLSLIMAER